MIVGAYSLDLYCDRCNPAGAVLYGEDQVIRDPGQVSVEEHRGFADYVGTDRAHCYRMARRNGWKLRLREGHCICPTCTREIKLGRAERRRPPVMR